jgi:hypothetical protein
MPEKLKKYFNGVSSILHSRADTAGVFTGNADIGRCREIICQEFLRKHLPQRFDVNLGGEIFGTKKQNSGQIDVIINHDMCSSFKENSLIRCPVESVIAAISIKSTLDKKQLIDALANLATIPQLDSEVLTTGVFSKPFNEYIVSWPSLFLFAYNSSITAEKCLEHMMNFYKTNPTPANRIPRAVIVNGKYAFLYLHYSANPSDLQCSILTPETQGCALFWMINEISKGLSWLNSMYLDYNKYYAEVYGVPFNASNV